MSATLGPELFKITHLASHYSILTLKKVFLRFWVIWMPFQHFFAKELKITKQVYWNQNSIAVIHLAHDQFIEVAKKHLPKFQVISRSFEHVLAFGRKVDLKPILKVVKILQPEEVKWLLCFCLWAIRNSKKLFLNYCMFDLFSVIKGSLRRELRLANVSNQS